MQADLIGLIRSIAGLLCGRYWLCVRVEIVRPDREPLVIIVQPNESEELQGGTR